MTIVSKISEIPSSTKRKTKQNVCSIKYHCLKTTCTKLSRMYTLHVSMVCMELVEILLVSAPRITSKPISEPQFWDVWYSWVYRQEIREENRRGGGGEEEVSLKRRGKGGRGRRGERGRGRGRSRTNRNRRLPAGLSLLPTSHFSSLSSLPATLSRVTVSCSRLHGLCCGLCSVKEWWRVPGAVTLPTRGFQVVISESTDIWGCSHKHFLSGHFKAVTRSCIYLHAYVSRGQRKITFQ